MAERRASEDSIARKGRMAATVIAVAGIAWLAANLIGGWLGLAPRFALLIDLLAIAAFVWALVVTLQIWRATRAQNRNH